MSDKENFGYLGDIFQSKVLAQIFTDRTFGENYINIVDPKYFDNQYFRVITQYIKEYYIKYDVIPTIDAIENIINSEASSEVTRRVLIDELEGIKSAELADSSFVQHKVINFCKQQELKKAIQKVQKILEKGDFESYDKCEDIIKRAINISEDKDNGEDALDNIENVLDNDERNPLPFGIGGFDRSTGGGLGSGEVSLGIAPLGTGKAQPLYSKVLTPNGWVTMGDIKIGDDVINSKGESTKVVGIYPQGVRPVYEVIFNDKTKTRCDYNHLWSVNTLNMRNSKTRRGSKIVKTPNNGYVVKPLRDLLGDIKKRGQLNYRIPIVEPIKFDEKPLEIHPYVLGLMLGDGYIGRGSIITGDIEIINYCKELYNGTINVYNRGNNFEVSFIDIKKNLRTLNLVDKKSIDRFIPNDYMYNSIENRVEVLQGLLDTDGYCSKSGVVEYYSISESLANDVKDLVLSLGGFSKIRLKKNVGYKKNGEFIKCNDCYVVSISLPEKLNINLFKLTRKQDLVRNRVKYSLSKFIKEVNHIGYEETKCIMIESSDHLYITDNYIVTHNSTCATKIANTNYNSGKTVLHIFFEDKVRDIKRKHYACWTGIPINDLKENKSAVIEIIEGIKGKGKLVLKKFPSYGTTFEKIRTWVKRQRQNNIIPDMIVIDYLDCIQLSEESWAAEGVLVRQFETLAEELKIPVHLFTQGGRQSIGQEVVTSDMGGGSIKKSQFAHFLYSIGRTMEQQENGRANLSILKNRFGPAGIVFENVLFDNGSVQIDTENGSEELTFLGVENKRDEKKRNRVNDILQKKQKEKIVIEESIL
jgi:hypothetical protein